MTPALRVSDAEREQVVNLLREHTADGRLSLDEFSQRSQVAYAARTRTDLDALTHDLPKPRPALQEPVASLPGWTLAIIIATIVLLGALGIAFLATMISHMSNMSM